MPEEDFIKPFEVDGVTYEAKAPTVGCKGCAFCFPIDCVRTINLPNCWAYTEGLGTQFFIFVKKD